MEASHPNEDENDGEEVEEKKYSRLWQVRFMVYGKWEENSLKMKSVMMAFPDEFNKNIPIDNASTWTFSREDGEWTAEIDIFDRNLRADIANYLTENDNIKSKMVTVAFTPNTADIATEFLGELYPRRRKSKKKYKRRRTY